MLRKTIKEALCVYKSGIVLKACVLYFLDTPKRNVRKQDRPISNSWYAEVGLWETSTSSPNDSSVSEQGNVMAGAAVMLTVLAFILNFC
jgi:hypothetical protein